MEDGDHLLQKIVYPFFEDRYYFTCLFGRLVAFIQIMIIIESENAET